MVNMEMRGTYVNFKMLKMTQGSEFMQEIRFYDRVGVKYFLLIFRIRASIDKILSYLITLNTF